MIRWSGNHVELHPDAQPPHVVKHYARTRKKNKRWKNAKYRVLRALGRPIPVEYRTPSERCLYESQCLQLWAEHGLAVPRVLSTQDGLDGGPVRLCIEWCEGERLDVALRDEHRSQADRFAIVRTVLRAVSDRHQLAIRLADNRFVQFDANLGNTLFTQQGPVWFDFGQGRSNESVQRSCVRELTKLCGQMTKALGRDHLDVVVRSMLSDYGIEDVLDCGVRDSTRGVLLPLRRLRRKRRQGHRPSANSRLDLYDAVAAAMKSRDGNG